MTLSFPAFEKNVRRQAKVEMRKDSQLWKDYKRHRPRRWRITGPQAGLGYLYFLGVSILLQGQSERYWTIALAFTLYATAAALFRTTNFLTKTLEGVDRQVLFYLPLADHDYLELEWVKYLKSWWTAFLTCAIGAGILLFREDALDWKYGAMIAAAAALFTACGLALGLWQIALFPRTLAFQIHLPFALATIGCLFLDPTDAHTIWPILLATPAGWITHALAAATGYAPAHDILWAVTALGFAASLPFAWRLVRPIVLSNLEGQTLVVSVRDIPYVDPREEIVIDLAAAAKTDDAKFGWIEKRLVKLFTPRQRAVFDFMGSGFSGTEFSNQMKYALAITLAGIVLAFSPVPPWTGYWVHAVIVVIAARDPKWLGFERASGIGFLTPMYAAFPVSFDEICQVVLITGVARIFLWAPLAFALALAQRDLPLFAKAFVILVAFKPILFTLKFSNTTNDSKRGGLRVWIHLIAILIFVGAGLAAAGMMLADFKPVVAAAGLLTASVLALLVYRSLFNGRGIDLLSLPS